MDKKYIKHLFATTLLCALTVCEAEAQSASFSEADGGNTLVISASGDLRTFSTTDNSKLVFTSNAVGEVFTNDAGTSVVANDVYNSSVTYYTSNKEWSKISNISSVTRDYIVDGSWTQDKMNGNLYHKNYVGQTNRPGQAASIEEYTLMNGYYGVDLNVNTEVGDGMSYYYEKDSEGNYTCISLADFKANYYTVTSETFYSNSDKLYVSIDNGLTKTIIPNGNQYSIVGNETYYTYEATYDVIANNETFFGTEHTNYLQVDPIEKSFVELLKDKLNSNAYTKVVFKNIGEFNTLLIDENIARAVLYPNADPNQYPYTSLTNVDFGEATLPGLSETTFLYNGNSSYAYMLANVPLVEFTIPLVPAVGGVIESPARVINNYNAATLRTLNVPAGYTKIGDNSFYNAAHITKVTLPESLLEIGNHAFELCPALAQINPVTDHDVVFPSHLETIGEWAFAGTQLRSKSDNLMLLPNSLTTIKAAAFSNVGYKDKESNFISTLEYLKLNEGLEFIGNSAFHLPSYDPSKLKDANQTTITFPSTLKYLGPASFFRRIYSDVYFTGTTAPACPVGPSVYEDVDMAAFNAHTHMGNNGFNPDPVAGSEADDAKKGYANRENYVNNGGVYFTILHFPAGISIYEAKTYKDITRRYETVEDLSTFIYNATMIPCGEEQGDAKTWVRSFHDYNSSENWFYSADEGMITAGHIDTYLGRQKIWPSQTQWMRAYTTVANGVEWNGVTEYRPTVTSDMIELMKKDNLRIYDPSTSSYVNIADNYAYTEASATQYNETLPGAIKAGSTKTTWTKEDADTKNATLENAVEAGQTVYYTEETATIHNAGLPNAVHENDVKIPATETVFYTAEELLTINDGFYAWIVNNGQYEAQIADYANHPDWYPYLVKTPATPATLYTADEAKVENAKLDGAVKDGDLIATFTEETAAAYNASLPGAVHEGEAKEVYTAEETKAHNAGLTGAVDAGDNTTVTAAFADYLSKILYQSTRRFVLADDTAPKDNKYEIPMAGNNWWTICLPFDLTKSQVDQIFGKGTHVCLFSAVERDKSTTPQQLTLRFQHDVYLHKTVRTYTVSGDNRVYTYESNFSKTNAAPDENDIVMYSHQSYMIYPTVTNVDAVHHFEKEGVEYFVVPEPIMVEGEPLPTRVNANEGRSIDDHTEYRFVGNYKSNNVENNVIVSVKVPQYSYFYAKKKNDPAGYKFWFVENGNQSWKKNKSLVQNHARNGGADDFVNFFNGNSASAKQTSIFGWSDEDDTPTDAENIVIIAGDGEDAATLVYGINGQLMNINSVRPGNIYIKNGKKYFVK